MDSRLFDTTQFTPLSDTVENDIRNLVFSPVINQRVCPNCMSEEGLNKKDLAEHVVLDVLDKEPVRVHISRQRYKCKNCGTTFTSGEDPYTDKCSVSDAFRDYLSQQMLKDNDFTYALAETKYGISPTTATKALNEYVEKYRKSVIISLQPCYRIMFVPFMYENTVHGCVCGTDNDDRNVILGFIENYTETAITEYITVNIDIHCVDVIFCAFVPDVVMGLRKAYPKIELAVMPNSITKHINSFLQDTGDGLFNEKAKCLSTLKQLLIDEYSNVDDFLSAVEDWEERIPQELGGKFDVLCSDLGKCIGECYNASSYDEDEFSVSSILDIISKFRKHKTPYGTMTFRIMFSNPHVYEQTKQTPMGVFMNTYSFRVSLPGIRNYCIYMKELANLDI